MKDLFKIIREGNINDLKSEISSQNINALNENKQSLLQEAVIRGKDEISKYLIENGIDINNQDNTGQTVLHYIPIYKNLDLAKEIFKNNFNINIQDIHGNIPLWTAVFNARGDYNIVKLYIENGANLDIKNKVNKSPYDLAIMMKFPELIELFESYKK